jgi:hypothetical protein
LDFRCGRWVHRTDTDGYQKEELRDFRRLSRVPEIGQVEPILTTTESRNRDSLCEQWGVVVQR